jgi:PAS domain S-box-containing protein
MNHPRAPHPDTAAAVTQVALALADDAIALTDGAGRIEWHNDRFAALTGWDGDSALGRPLLELLRGPLTDAPTQRRLDEALARHGGFAPCRLRHYRRGGASFEDRIAARRIDGAPRRCVFVLREVALPQPGGDDTGALLRLAVDLASIAIWRHDLAAGRLHLNDKAYAVLGLAPRAEGLAVDELAALIHPDDLARVRASVEESLRSARPVDVQARYRRSDGSWRRLLMRRVVQRGADGTALAFVGVALDVTGQLDSSRHALELARRLELTTAAAGVGVWIYRTARREVEWNDRMFALSGLPGGSEPLEPRRWVERVVHPDDRERARRETRRWLREARPDFEIELRVLHADGSVRWVVNRARLDRGAQGETFLGIALDVTERHRTQQALRNADERAALAARGAGIGTWERDLKSGQAQWDEQMFHLRGLEPQPQAPDAAGRMAEVHPDDRAAVRAAHALAAAGAPASYEYRVRWPDGSQRWLAARAVPLADEHGATERLIGVNWDITEARNADHARRETELALRESRAKSQFLARMSHELRTPLNAVLGFTQLLQVEEDGSASARGARLAHIRTGGEHLLALIDEVLDLSSLEAGQVRLDIAAVPLAEVAREALAMVERLAAERGIAIETGALEGSPLVDRTRLRQVLINLLSNAIKYNRPGGRVSLRASAIDSQLSIRVADTGRGMSREQLAHLFEPFNRLGVEREGIEGSGIGLVIVKVLVERMGGAVSVTSEAGRGSVFELKLRLPEAQAAAAVPHDEALRRPAAAAHGHDSRRGRLLYIEDNPVNTLLVAELVAQRPALALACANDGASGVARARELRPDLILVDMQLPDFDGHEVLRRLRLQAETASIPCIALSANAMSEDIDRALGAGFADYWTKPIDLKAFLAALDTLFG